MQRGEDIAMKSPFPGMDPYLEGHWGDVHTTAMIYAKNQINGQLPRGLRARVQEALSVMEDDILTRTVYPDVRVFERSGNVAEEAEPATLATAVAEPYVVTLEDDPQTWRHIEVVDTSDGGRVVTVIELLSPANKVGLQGQLSYIRKQQELWHAGVNLVEIDLVRAGSYVLAFPEDRLPRACRTTYLACVRRAASRYQAELYPMPLRQPLRDIRVPLRPADRDVVLRLQELIDACYRDGGYDTMDYRANLEPRFDEADAAWTDALLREKGLR
jgi:hypothetical protein